MSQNLQMFFMGLTHIPMNSSKLFRGIGNSLTPLAVIEVFTLIPCILK